MKKFLSIATLCTLALAVMTSRGADVSRASGVPRIEFETNFFDFGTINTGDELKGVFKFKNTGNGVLKIQPPQASCDCTEPRVKPDTVAPGESGEILYTIKLDRPLNGQRFIHVLSNDPQTPNVKLTVQLDYSPLYELDPKTLWVTLPAGRDEVQVASTVTRSDDQPLELHGLTASQNWARAAFDSSFKPGATSARIKVTVHRPPGPPGPLNATIKLWNSNNAAQPVQSILLSGEALGELAAVPSRIYWVIPDFGKDKSAYPAEALTRKIQLISVLGHDVQFTNASSNIENLSLQIVPTDPGKRFDLILKFDELPHNFANTNLTIETSLASLPKLEVPITVAVPDAH